MLNDENEFLQELIDESNSGSEIIPLAGAGISVASGIPAIPQLEKYLRSCVMLALRSDHDNRKIPWTPHSQWPDLNFFEINPELRPTEPTMKEISDSVVWQKGWGDTSDWRHALNFLSRLDEQNGRLRLVSPQNAIIDSFFRHVTMNKTPNLTHRMLATLASIGRVRLLLTTNFDELIEGAMREAHLRLTTIALHNKATLPPYDTFDKDITLLKMHGGRYGLRADDSLDVIPLQDEIQTFRNYFYRHGESKSSAVLLVVGTSLNDVRMKAFLQSLVEKKHTETLPKIFWICYSSSDIETAKSFADKSSDIFLHQSKDTGLLLYKFYQMLMKSLPYRDAIFPTPMNVSWPPSAPLTSLGEAKREEPTVRQKIKDRIITYGDEVELTLDQAAENHKCKLTETDTNFLELIHGRRLFSIVRTELNAELDRNASVGGLVFIGLLGGSNYQGITSMAGAVFHDRVGQGEHSLWFDLDDAGSTNDFFEQLRATIAERATAGKWIASKVSWDEEQKAKELARYMKLMPGRWNVFINSREKAGWNGPDVSGIREEMREKDREKLLTFKNGWLDFDVNQREEHLRHFSDHWEAFERLICGILSCESGIPANFVLVAHGVKGKPDNRNQENQSEKRESNEINEDELDSPSWVQVNLKRLVPESQQYTLQHSGKMPATVTTSDGSGDTGTPGKNNEHWKKSALYSIEGTIAFFKEASVVEQVEKWVFHQNMNDNTSPRTLSEALRRWRFVCALVLMKHARHLSTPHGYAFRMNRVEVANYGNEELLSLAEKQNIHSVDQMLQDLTNTGLIRWKPGGYIWLHSGSRDSVREHLSAWFTELRKLRPQGINRDLSSDTFLIWSNAHCHLGIANLYRRLLQSTEEAQAAIHAVHHLCLAAQEFGKLANSKLDGKNGTPESHFGTDRENVKYCYAAALDALLDARRLIRLNRSRLVLQGISTGKCRRLESINWDVLFPLIKNLMTLDSQNEDLWKEHRTLFTAALRLRHSLFKCMSMIARETGEIATAYARLRQYVLSKYQEFAGPEWTREKFLKGITGSDVEDMQILLNSRNDTQLNSSKEADQLDVATQKETSAVGGLELYQKNCELLKSAPFAWLKYARAIAVLHIASRSYMECQNSLLRCFMQLNTYAFEEWGKRNETELDDVIKLDREIRKWLQDHRDRYNENCPDLGDLISSDWQIRNSLQDFLNNRDDHKNENVINTDMEIREWLKDHHIKYDHEVTLHGEPPEKLNLWEQFVKPLLVEGKFDVKRYNEMNKDGVPTASVLALLAELELAEKVCDNIREFSVKTREPRAAREIVKLAHRQLQLSSLIIELIEFRQETEMLGETMEDELSSLGTHKKKAKIDEVYQRRNVLLDQVRRRAFDAGHASYGMAMRIIDHYGAEELLTDEMDDREHERRRLLEEMQRLETFSAVLFCQRGSVARRKPESDSERTPENYQLLANRALDHAAAWLQSNSDKELPIAIIEIQKVSQALAFSDPVFGERCVPLVQAIKQELLDKLVLPKTAEYARDLISGKKSLRRYLEIEQSDILGVVKYPELKDHSSDEVSSAQEEAQKAAEAARRVSKQGSTEELVVANKTATEAKKVAVRVAKKARLIAFSISIGKLEIAGQMLRRAESMLMPNRRSVWWAGKLDELKLLHTRSVLYIHILAGKTAPPILRNAIIQKWDTPIQDTMTHVSHLLRLDSIRFARCLHLYAECVFAIWVLKYSDEKKYYSKYDETIQNMLNQIAGSQVRLKDMISTKRAGEEKHASPRPHDLTTGYFEELELLCNRIKAVVSLSDEAY
ncbi:SIR2 family protein [Gimesia panareensis]|uniref:SIR2 family protein n=1 Tax=Gimesia panareensis TaxID=2527978 RepID=UPI0018D6C15E|nr:SIR2 family protein [Gimesia panareensis]